jgi:hypothetical protein
MTILTIANHKIIKKDENTDSISSLADYRIDLIRIGTFIEGLYH